MIFAVGKVGGILDNQKNQSNYFLQNMEFAINVFKVSRLANLNKVIVFGSSCMYPLNETQPYKEDKLLNGPLEETSKGYALAKLVLAQGSIILNSENRPIFIPIIPNSSFGPHDNYDPNTSHVLSALIKKFHDAKVKNNKLVSIFGSGKPKREFIFSQNVASSINFLLKNIKSQPNLPINIGPGQEFTIYELAKTIASVVGYKGEIKFDLTKPDGAYRKLLSYEQIKQMGWKPEISFNEGLKKTYNWFVKNYE